MDMIKTNRAVLFFDLKNWYRKQEGKKADEIAEDLNAFYERTIDLATRHKGRVVKFMGDAALLLFDTAADALGFARALLSSSEANVGIEQGEIVQGTFGKEPLRWFDAIGPAVNEASINVGRASKSGTGIVLGPRAWAALEDKDKAGIACSKDLD